MRKSTLFLLYVSVMLIITFLQQEFVLLPELQNLDIVGEDAKAQLLERYQRMRWVSFLLVPILLALHLSLVSLCLFIGSFFFTETNGKKFKDWWGVATVAQAVMLSYSVILCIVNIAFGANHLDGGDDTRKGKQEGRKEGKTIQSCQICSSSSIILLFQGLRMDLSLSLATSKII